jgi:hypothetical protein
MVRRRDINDIDEDEDGLIVGTLMTIICQKRIYQRRLSVVVLLPT